MTIDRYLVCRTHKDNSMINVKSKRCQHLGCDKIPIFNKKGENRGIFCVLHRESDMVDVKHKPCQHIEGCKKKNIVWDSRISIYPLCGTQTRRHDKRIEIQVFQSFMQEHCSIWN